MGLQCRGLLGDVEVHVLLPSFCELCYPPSCAGEEPKPGRSGAFLPRGFMHASLPQVLALVMFLKNLYVHSHQVQLLETFICAISMIRGDAGQGNEAGEVLKREILTAPAPCLRLAHRCRATFCAAGQTGPAGRVSISCIYAQACVPVHPRIHTSSV